MYLLVETCPAFILSIVYFAACVNRRLDVSITADTSESVHDIANKIPSLLSFITDIVKDKDIDSENVRFSLTVFHHFIFNEFQLDTYTTAEDILNHIANLDVSSGGTNTGGALKNLYTTVFVPEHGDRPDAPNLAIIVTDGRSNNNTYTVEQAAEAKSRGIHLIVVGIGLTDTSELYQIASSPASSNVFNVESYEHLPMIEDAIEQTLVETCKDEPKTPNKGKYMYI
ncbi:COEA1-like protein [Mya arenaria]|uniref:COEA1-like protein n=1 Tax=Mya arenaria TaxID=6604 RepID=A0ABY7FY47_MYAAR|nr:COEA1-like protein [Mya arenaria]